MYSMISNGFNLFSLTGQRLYQAIKDSACQLDQYSINQAARLLYKNNIHLMHIDNPQNAHARRLADNILNYDPCGIHYKIQSEAEHNLLDLFNETPLLVEAEDMVESVYETGLSFVESPNTLNQKIWDFTIGSAPVVYAYEKKRFLPADHPEILTISDLGLAKSMRYSF